MSDKGVKILAKLIESKPDFQDENGKGIWFGSSKIYLKDIVIVALITIIVLSLCNIDFSSFKIKNIVQILASLGEK